MEKYKICPNPNCGKHNNPKAIECAWCEADLSGVKPTDDETEKQREQNEQENATGGSDGQFIVPPNHTGNMVRICDNCGTQNAANARKCSACGEDIADVTPTPADIKKLSKKNANVKKHVLTEVDGSGKFCVPDGNTVIGREHEMKDLLCSKHFVSRKHAELELKEEGLFIKNLSKTNYTFVNNARIDDSEVELHDGDEIGLGGNNVDGKRQSEAAYFIVKVE